MAKNVDTQYKSKFSLPSPINRLNPIPNDSTQVWDTFANAQNYATNGPTAYVGQLLFVQETGKYYLIKDTAGTLEVLGTGASGLVDDVKVDGTSVVTDRVANIDLTGKLNVEGYQSITDNDQEFALHYTSTDYKKLTQFVVSKREGDGQYIGSAVAGNQGNDTAQFLVNTDNTDGTVIKSNVKSGDSETTFTITATDATLSKMGTSENSVVTKKYVDDRVVANNSEETTATISKLKIGDTNYAISGGGGGTITDVKVDGSSVVTSGVANIDLSGKLDKIGGTLTQDFALLRGEDGAILAMNSSGMAMGAHPSSGAIIELNDTAFCAQYLSESKALFFGMSDDGIQLETDNNGLLITDADATLTKMGSTDASIVTKKYVDDQDAILNERIDNVQGLGRYLSTWNCKTGLPETEPTTSPYTYKTGDYYIITVVATESGDKNYKPDGKTYTTGVASTVEETNQVLVNDYYLFDGTNWKVLKAIEKAVTFKSLVGEPADNTALGNALNSKQAKLTAGDNIIIDENNKISSTGGLPTGTEAGQALIFNNSNWTKQSGYGYTDETHDSFEINWDGVSCDGKTVVQMKHYADGEQTEPDATWNLYKLADYTPAFMELIKNAYIYGAYCGPDTDVGRCDIEGNIKLLGGIFPYTITDYGYSICFEVNLDAASYPNIFVFLKPGEFVFSGYTILKATIVEPGIYSAKDLFDSATEKPHSGFLKALRFDFVNKIDSKLTMPTNDWASSVWGTSSNDNPWEYQSIGMPSPLAGAYPVFNGKKWTTEPAIASWAILDNYSYWWNGDTAGRKMLVSPISSMACYKIAECCDINIKLNIAASSAELSETYSLRLGTAGSPEPYFAEEFYLALSEPTSAGFYTIVGHIGPQHIMTSKSGNLLILDESDGSVYGQISIVEAGIYLAQGLDKISYSKQLAPLKQISKFLLPLEFNPTLSEEEKEAAEDLEYIKFGDPYTVYKITGGSGTSLVDDVKVDGVSVVTNKIANIDLTGKLNTTENGIYDENDHQFYIMYGNVNPASTTESIKKISCLEVSYGGDGQYVSLGSVGNNGNDTAQFLVNTDNSEGTMINSSITSGDSENSLKLTVDDATLSKMGSTDNSITTKQYVDTKQNKLTAGTNITIDENNVISAAGGMRYVQNYAGVTSITHGTIKAGSEDIPSTIKEVRIDEDKTITYIITADSGYVINTATGTNCTVNLTGAGTSSGTVVISAFTADNWTVEIACRALALYNISSILDNVTASSTNPTTIREGSSATLAYSANEGYNLPDTIIVTGADYTWDKVTGTVTLTNPTSNVSITITGTTSTFAVTWNLTNGTANPQITSIAPGDDTYITITPSSGYVLPTDITVSGCDYEWDPNTDEEQLYLSAATSDVDITISCQQEQTYPVTWNLTNCTASPQITSISNGEEVLIEISTESGYIVPDNITVTGCEYYWSYEDNWGELILYEAAGPVSITIAAHEEHSYPIVWNLNHCTVSPQLSTLSESADEYITITPEEGYVLPEDISVSGCEYSWDSESEEEQLNVWTPESNVSITIECTAE